MNKPTTPEPTPAAIVLNPPVRLLVIAVTARSNSDRTGETDCVSKFAETRAEAIDWAKNQLIHAAFAAEDSLRLDNPPGPMIYYPRPYIAILNIGGVRDDWAFHHPAKAKKDLPMGMQDESPHAATYPREMRELDETWEAALTKIAAIRKKRGTPPRPTNPAKS